VSFKTGETVRGVELSVSSRLRELVRTAPDWTSAETLSADVRAWLDRALQLLEELDPVEAGILQVHLQFIQDDTVRHGAEIVEALWRVEKKVGERENPSPG